MRSLAVRSLLAAPVAELLMITLSACQPMSARSQMIHCNVMLDAPTRDNPQTPKTIVSGVRYWCENPGAGQLAITLRMQKQNAKGDWVDVAKTSFTAKGALTVRTDDLRYRSKTISVRCGAGTYRTMVTGKSSGAQTKTADYNLEGSPSSDPCTPAIQFR